MNRVLLAGMLVAVICPAAGRPTLTTQGARAGVIASQNGRVARQSQSSGPDTVGSNRLKPTRRDRGRASRAIGAIAAPTPVYINLGAAEAFAYLDVINFTDRLFILNAGNAETNSIQVQFDFGVQPDAPEYFELLWCSLNTLSGDYYFDFSLLAPADRYVYQGDAKFLDVTHLALIEQVLCAGNLGFDDFTHTYFNPPSVSVSYLELSPTDFDGDGVLDTEDNCLSTYNADQEDSDHDLLGDVCDLRIDDPNFIGADLGYFDDDFDGIADHDVNFNVLPADTVVGSDKFGNPYFADNCPDIYNPLQWDTDLDGTGDACDVDYVFLGSVFGSALGNEADVAGRTVGVADYTHSIRIRASDKFILNRCEVTYFDEALQDYFVLTYDFAALAADGTYDFPAFSSEFLTLAQDVYVSDVSCLAYGAADQVIDVYYKPGVLFSCVGDCNSDGQVTIDELVKGVTIALGNQNLSLCQTLDQNSDDQVTVDELVQAVYRSLDGCLAGGGGQ